jgi:hypothetical protein
MIITEKKTIPKPSVVIIYFVFFDSCLTRLGYLGGNLLMIDLDIPVVSPAIRAYFSDISTAFPVFSAALPTGRC